MSDELQCGYAEGKPCGFCDTAIAMERQAREWLEKNMESIDAEAVPTHELITLFGILDSARLGAAVEAMKPDQALERSIKGTSWCKLEGIHDVKHAGPYKATALEALQS